MFMAKVFLYCSSSGDHDEDPRWFKLMMTQDEATRILRRIDLAKKIREIDEHFSELVFQYEEGRFYQYSNDNESDVREDQEHVPMLNCCIVVDTAGVIWIGTALDSSNDIRSHRLPLRSLVRISKGIPLPAPHEEEEVEEENA